MGANAARSISIPMSLVAIIAGILAFSTEKFGIDVFFSPKELCTFGAAAAAVAIFVGPTRIEKALSAVGLVLDLMILLFEYAVAIGH